MHRGWLIAVVAALTPLAGCLSDPGSPDDFGADGSQVQPGVDDPELAATGRWLPPFEGEVPAINMVVLHTGEVLYWSGVEARDETNPDYTFFTSYPYEGESRVLDLSGPVPQIITPETPSGAGRDLFCSGQTILADGRILTVGSSDWHTIQDNPDSPFLRGGEDARIFDPESRAWSAAADMNLGRWYPSIITGADGTPIVASGIEDLTQYDDIWREWEDYDVESDTWSKVDGIDVLLPLYPRITLVGGGPFAGDVFYNTVGTMWGPFGEHPEQQQWSTQRAIDLDGSGHRDVAQTNIPARQHAASVMLPLTAERDYAPEFVTFGGSLYQTILATPFTEHTDLSTDPPANTQIASMNHPRWHLNGVALPDGTVLAVGGGMYDNVVIHGQENVPIMEAEVFDPETGTWTDLAPMAVPRMYHSSAVLLPDGRVLAGGHVPLPNPFEAMRDTVNPQVAETRLEIFEPPYLFRGDRPVIADAPSTIGYGESFTVDVELPAALDGVMLIHPGATTHSFDSNQRAIELEVIEQGNGTLTLQAPPDGFVAPPGHYMLFVSTSHGAGPVPSEAAWVSLGAVETALL